MTCIHCETRKTIRWYGSYFAGCAGCAAALVISARPLKAAQEAMLFALTRRGLLTRTQILEAVKAKD